MFSGVFQCPLQSDMSYRWVECAKNIRHEIGWDNELESCGDAIRVHSFAVHDVVLHHKSGKLPEVATHSWLAVRDCLSFRDHVMDDEIFHSSNIFVLILALTDLFAKKFKVHGRSIVIIWVCLCSIVHQKARISAC